MRTALALSACTLLWLPSASAQSALAEWRLTRASDRIGDDSELHQVYAAALMPDRQLAIADRGNSRIVVATQGGELVRTIGRAGSGPGEFRVLSEIAVFGDTIAMESPRSFIVTSSMPRASKDGGVFIDSAAVMRFRDGALTTLGRTAWEQSVLVVQGIGSTTYPAPFLGRGMVFATRGCVALVPLNASAVTILEGPSAGKSVDLGVARRPFDRSLIDRHRDSLVAILRPRAAQFPGAADRVSTAFGPTFPTPKETPVFDGGVAIGDQIWLRRTPDAAPSDNAEWVIFDARGERFVARVGIPRNVTLLGGEGDRLLLLERDEDGVEAVVIHSITRGR